MVLRPALRPSSGRPRRWALGLLGGGGLLSCLVLAATPHEGLHPLALIGALLPLQLTAWLWATQHRR